MRSIDGKTFAGSILSRWFPIASVRPSRSFGCGCRPQSFAFPGRARADFRLCNNTSLRVSVSLAYTTGQNWVQEGWWNLKDRGLRHLAARPIGRRKFYYVYAMDERGGEWKGKTFMCTSNLEFRDRGTRELLRSRLRPNGFFSKSLRARKRRIGRSS